MSNNFNAIIIKQMESAIKDAFPPFQIFVRAPDESLLTLTLPDGLDTSVNDILTMIERRTGISTDDTRLDFGGKPLRESLTLRDYNIHKNSTLTAQGRLLGGFGERAAIIKTAALNIKRGNVKSDLQATSGESQVIKNWARTLKRDPKLINWIKQQAVDNNLCSDLEKDTWFSENSDHIKGLIVATAHGGNCGDYAQVVYSTLLQDTTGQYVYQVVMNLKDDKGESFLDHQFVVTSPNNHGRDIAALANDNDAVVADAWWGNAICNFPTFVKGENPYWMDLTDFSEISKKSKVVVTQLSNLLSIVANSPLTTGTKFNATMKGIIESAVTKGLENYKKTSEFTTEKSKVNIYRGFGTPAGNDMDDKRTIDQVKSTLKKAYMTGKEQFLSELSLLTSKEILSYYDDVKDLLIVFDGPDKQELIDALSPDQLLILSLSSDKAFHEISTLSKANRLYIRLGTATVQQFKTFMSYATDLELQALLDNAYTPLDAKFTTHLDGISVSDLLKLFPKCSTAQQSYYLLNGSKKQTQEFYNSRNLIMNTIFPLLDTFNSGTKASFKVITDCLGSYYTEVYFTSNGQRGRQRPLLL